MSMKKRVERVLSLKPFPSLSTFSSAEKRLGAAGEGVRKGRKEGGDAVMKERGRQFQGVPPTSPYLHGRPRQKEMPRRDQGTRLSLFSNVKNQRNPNGKEGECLPEPTEPGGDRGRGIPIKTFCREVYTSRSRELLGGGKKLHGNGMLHKCRT